MKRFLFSQSTYEAKRRPNIVSGKIIFALNALERHTARQASDHYRDRHASASDDGLTVTNGGVYNH